MRRFNLPFFFTVEIRRKLLISLLDWGRRSVIRGSERHGGWPESHPAEVVFLGQRSTGGVKLSELAVNCIARIATVLDPISVCPPSFDEASVRK